MYRFVGAGNVIVFVSIIINFLTSFSIPFSLKTMAVYHLAAAVWDSDLFVRCGDVVGW